jgi:hypothetical protein
VEPGPDPRAPVLRNLRFQRIEGALLATASLGARDPDVKPFFDPYTPDGWSFQLFMNTDQGPSGYWNGYDYLVRGVELREDFRIPIRLTKGDPKGPGGWGAESGETTLQLHDGMMSFEIPLSAIGDDDGEFDYALEFYLTETCASCPDSVRQDFATVYFGGSSPTRYHIAYELQRGRFPRGPGRNASERIAR